MFGDQVPVPQRIQVIGDNYLPEWQYTTNKVQSFSIDLKFNNKDLLKVIKESIFGFASYPSKTKSTTVMIDLHLKKLFAEKVNKRFEETR